MFSLNNFCDECRPKMAAHESKPFSILPLCEKCLKAFTQDVITNSTKNEHKYDPVNHPSHYTDSKIEVLNAIEAWKMPYHLGQVIKYVARAGKKSAETYKQDLEKAKFYLDRYIKLLESGDDGVPKL